MNSLQLVLIHRARIPLNFVRARYRKTKMATRGYFCAILIPRVRLLLACLNKIRVYVTLYTL